MPVQFPIYMEYRPPLCRRGIPADLRDHHSTGEGICQKKNEEKQGEEKFAYGTGIFLNKNRFYDSNEERRGQMQEINFMAVQIFQNADIFRI